MSSIVGYGEKNVTVWKWYWEKSPTEWMVYDATVILLLQLTSPFVILLQPEEIFFETFKR